MSPSRDQSTPKQHRAQRLKSTSPVVVLYTDGACTGNPGPGGWAVIVLDGKKKIGELTGGKPKTTNNRMELTAAIRGLKALKKGTTVEVYTDSKYLINCAESWIAGWKERGWLKADGTPPMNEGLLRKLDLLLSQHPASWHWVKGHNGDKFNEKVDALAQAAARKHGRSGR